MSLWTLLTSVMSWVEHHLSTASGIPPTRRYSRYAESRARSRSSGMGPRRSMDSRKSNAPLPMRAMTNSPKHIGRIRMNVTFPTGKECAASTVLFLKKTSSVLPPPMSIKSPESSPRWRSAPR